jgi:hypothetical protein
VNRDLKDEELDFLHKSAYTGGLDFVHKWHNKDWEFDFSMYGSRVAGSTEAIQRTQEAWTRLFQRPDASYLGVDPTRTSLSGYGGKIVLAEFGGNFRFMHGITFKSPGLELNDVGYLREADNILQVFWMGFRTFKPAFIFRELYLNFNQWTEWNFGGDLTSPGGNINFHSNLTNFWSVDMGTNMNFQSLSYSALRGGPSLKMPGNYNGFVAFRTNDQKKMTFELESSFNQSFEKNYSENKGMEIELSYRPLKTLKFSFSPGYQFSKNALQYITQAETDGKNRYVFGTIQRNTLSASFRIDLNLTPELSLQYWGQPFIASGKYSHFKKITNNMAEVYTDRFKEYSPSEINYNTAEEEFNLTENGFGTISFEQPDFNVKEFLSNMVVRWEYTPGSTLYLVWSQNRSSNHSDGSFDFGRDIDRLFSAHANNIFLIKLSYRFGR